MLRFARSYGIHPGMKVLDVGGNPSIWELLAPSVRPQVTFLNMPRAAEPTDDQDHLVFADGRQLPFSDGAFDVVFSNSVIEHVGNAESQTSFAGEIARVGHKYWVQTPNRLFPVEQHLMTPFIHWLPKPWQGVIVPHATIWGLLTQCNDSERQFYFEHFLYDIHLLDERQLRSFFPDAAIERERFLGLTKSLIAARR